MKRTLLMLTAALSLSLGAAAAQADFPGGFAPPAQPWSSQAVVAGTITSVNDSGGVAGTFKANAYLVTSGPDGPGSTPPATTPVTITLGSNTGIRVPGVNGTATVDDLKPNQTFYADYSASPATE